MFVANKNKQSIFKKRGDYLVIVESPHKIKPLKKILGDKYDIIATKGHICEFTPDECFYEKIRLFAENGNGNMGDVGDGGMDGGEKGDGERCIYQWLFSPSFASFFTVIDSSFFSHLNHSISLYTHSNIFIATDNDFEGRAIAFHCIRLFSLQSAQFVSFNQINASSVLNAFSGPYVVSTHFYHTFLSQLYRCGGDYSFG
jgi:DNA topoisomerase IA